MTLQQEHGVVAEPHGERRQRVGDGEVLEDGVVGVLAVAVAVVHRQRPDVTRHGHDGEDALQREPGTQQGAL